MESELVGEIISDAEDRMKKAVAALAAEFSSVRTGRASPVLVEKINVDYYGAKTPLYQMASINVPEPQLIVIQAWDKTAIASIEKAIMQSDLGLTPSNDGNVIRLPFPPLNEERRRDLVRLTHKMAEEGRVAVRNIRRDANDDFKELEKEKDIGKDDRFRAEEEMQKLTDKYVHEIEERLSHKEAEIMEV